MHSFPCGTLSLDFVGTRQARRSAEPTEMLSTPDALEAWLRESGLLSAPGVVTPAELTRAVEVREAIYALIAARLREAPMPAAAIALVNEVSATRPLHPELQQRGWTRRGDAAGALAELAREVIPLLGGEDARLLRECSRPECTQVYLDHSRGRRREWCSMATCGSRMKAKAYRDRRKADAASVG